MWEISLGYHKGYHEYMRGYHDSDLEILLASTEQCFDKFGITLFSSRELDTYITTLNK